MNWSEKSWVLKGVVAYRELGMDSRMIAFLEGRGMIFITLDQE